MKTFNEFFELYVKATTKSDYLNIIKDLSAYTGQEFTALKQKCEQVLSNFNNMDLYMRTHKPPKRYMDLKNDDALPRKKLKINHKKSCPFPWYKESPFIYVKKGYEKFFESDFDKWNGAVIT